MTERERIIQNLRRMARELHRTPSLKQYIEKHGYQIEKYRYNDLVIEAGLKPNKRKSITKKQILNNIKTLANELQTTPTIEQYKEKYGYLDLKTHKYTDLVTEAGLKPNFRRLTKEIIVENIKKLAEELGRIPRISHYREKYKHINITRKEYEKLIKNNREYIGFLTKEEIIRKKTRDNIQEYIDKYNKTPTIEEYREHYGNFSNYCGNYTEFLLKNNFKVNMFTSLTNEEIQQIYIDYIEKNGVPLSEDIAKKNLPSKCLIYNRFGNYSNFLKSIGYSPVGYKRYTKKEIIEILKKGIDKGEIKSTTDLPAHNYPYLNTIYNILEVKSWKEVLQLLGKEELYRDINMHDKYDYSKKQLKDMYIQLSKRLRKLEYGATVKDVREHLGFTRMVFERVYNKTWREIKKEFGYEIRKTNTLKYTEEGLLNLVANIIVQNQRFLKIKELKLIPGFPSIATFKRYLKVSSIKKIYQMLIDKNYIKIKNDKIIRLKKED